MAIYSPLNIDTEEIRLLELQPAEKPEMPLCGILRHVSLASSPARPILAYDAISYVWGKPDFDKNMFVADQALPITSRVEHMLSTLRYKSKARVLWIDSICIDQSNIHERGQQILLMRKIYSKGQRNIACVTHSGRWGITDQGIQSGMEILKKICNSDSATLASFRRENERLFGDERELLRGGKNNPNLVLDVDARDALFSFLMALDEGIWGRIWIVQEFSLAKKVTLRCEDAELDWDLVSSFLRDEPYFDAFHMPGDARIGRNQFPEIFSRAKLFEDQRTVTQRALTSQYQEKATGSDLLEILARFRDMESSDPRDKVFGLLGLVDGPHHVDVEYSKSVLQIWTETTLSIIKCSKNLDIICQNPFESICTRGNGKEADQRSSWVPDFCLHQSECLSVLFAQRGIFNAGSKTMDTPCTIADGKSEILVLKSVVLDRIGPLLRPSEQELDELPWTLHSICGSARHILDFHFGNTIIDDWQKELYLPRAASRFSRPEPAETRIRAFWRTLARDCTAPPNMRRLQKSEIETLDTKNSELLKSGSNIKTLRGVDDRYSGLSSFRFDPRDYAPDLYCSSPFRDIPHRLTDYTFNVSKNDLFMMVRPYAQEGDIVVVLDGGKVPMILREQSPHLTERSLGSLHRIVGPAYVHGFIDGEVDAAVAAGLLKKPNLFIC